MRLDSNFSGFSVNEASFRSQVEGSGEGKRAHGGGGAKKACCGRGCCEQGRQKIALDDLSGLLKTTDASTSTDSQKSVQEKPRHHEHHDFNQASATKQKPHNDVDALFKQLDSSSTATSSDSQNTVQEKPRHHGHHGRPHGEMNKVSQDTVTAQAV